MEQLYNKSKASYLLGCILNNTNLLFNSQFPLSKKDFEPYVSHKILYVTAYMLGSKGVKSIDAKDIGTLLESYPSQLNTLVDTYSDWVGYIETIKQLDNDGSFEYYYNEVRKMSLLRAYRDNGIDIKELWDFEKSEEENNSKLDKYTIADICNYFDKINSSIIKEFKLSSNTEEMIVGDEIDDLLNEFQESPMIGAGLTSPYLNSLYRGWCRGHLILRGSGSGFGKTILGIADQCNVSAKKIWSEEKQDFIDNPYYQGKGAYIHTEQKMREEIQPRFLSSISNVPYNVILDGTFTREQKERLSEAGRILKDSELKLINYPEFTGTGLKEYIKDLSLDGYEYVTFDYIWCNAYIIGDLKSINGANMVREDQALLHLANVLKMSAEEYNVGLATMIQLNGREKEVEIVDESCLFGSRSIKTKLDNGSVFMSPKQKELAQVDLLIQKWNKKNESEFGQQLRPNAVSHIFKARYGRYGLNLKIFHHLDRSTGKLTDMFVTTWDNKPIEIPKFYITNDSEEGELFN